MGKRDPRLARIWREINAILANDWDPVSGSEDEYVNYVPSIYQLLEAGIGEQALADHLHELETGPMSVRGDQVTCLLVARKLRAISLA